MTHVGLLINSKRQIFKMYFLNNLGPIVVSARL